MINVPDTVPHAAVCETCGGPLGGRRYLRADGPSLRRFCSEACVRAAVHEEETNRRAVRRRRAKWLAIGAGLVGVCLTPHAGPFRPPRAARAIPAHAGGDARPPRLPPGWFGPEWPPTETSLLAALGRDSWVHPLAGPVRRMPRSDSRVFGAVRPGDRAIECRNGHCGVDLGGEIWGEHVHAVHDGVVDWVQRGPNQQRGGEFVRLSHRNGTVFTQYFHLAAIRRGLERGTPVKGGDVIGLLGDTGVKESEPHLHFAISIRPTNGGAEKYIDPEPLVALWALRVPLDGSEAGLVTTVGETGVPLGSASLLPGRKRRAARAKQQRASDGAGKSEGSPAESAPAPEDTGAPEPSTDD
jgi:hypothetical protein